MQRTIYNESWFARRIAAILRTNKVSTAASVPAANSSLERAQFLHPVDDYLKILPLTEILTLVRRCRTGAASLPPLNMYSASQHSMPDPRSLQSTGSSGSLDEIHEEKRALKKALRQWELDFEEAHGGLVPTHEDKKHDPTYLQIKAKAKTVEKNLDVTRRATRKSEATGSTVPPRLSTAGSSAKGLGVRLGSSTSSTQHYPKRFSTTNSASFDGDEGQFSFEAGRISLSPFHVLVLSIACAIPYLLFCGLFSLMGMGALVYDYLVSSSSLFYPLTLSAVGLLVILYLFDVSYWEHPVAVWAVMQRLCRPRHCPRAPMTHAPALPKAGSLLSCLRCLPCAVPEALPHRCGWRHLHCGCHPR